MSFLLFAGSLIQSRQSVSVLFIVGNAASPTSGDSNIKTHIENRGYTVTYLEDSDVVGNESGYDCILISESVESGNISNKLKDSNLPILLLEYLNLSDSALASLVRTDTGETEWDLIDDNHPIATGLSNGLVTIFSSAAQVRHVESASNLGGGGDVVFNSPDGSNRPSVFVYEAGATLVGGSTANSRRAYMPFEHANWDIFTSDAKTIFDNTLDWVIGL